MRRLLGQAEAFGLVSRTGGITPLFAALILASWIVSIDNASFWSGFIRGRPGGLTAQVMAAAGLGALLVLALAALLRPLVSRRVGRWVTAAVLLLCAGTAHFVDRFGILLDANLVTSIFETDPREVRELLSWPMLLDLILRGVFPALFLRYVVVRPSTRAAWFEAPALALTAALAGVVLLTGFSGIYVTTFRNHRELRLQLVPLNAVRAAHGYLKAQRVSKPGPPEPIALDAVRPLATPARPRVFVLVVGETARAANFSLGGYGRDTNRPLEGLSFTYFSRVRACGTDTATSLPCMFSNLGAENFSASRARARENVLDVLSRTGVQVQWLDNNSGCKGVCARVKTLKMSDRSGLPLCTADGCHDEVLLPALDETLNSVASDALIVLHGMGSHGPSYYKRYPAPGVFQPTCDTNRIQSCSSEALVNTYDNTIEYTSRMLAQVLRAARMRSGSLDIAVLYISDHGESLGEYDVYLHGMPLPFAPREQTEVPMLSWLSPGAAQHLKIGASCLSAISHRPLSHDNLFHTLLGYYGVETSAYKAGLDLFALARQVPQCPS